jgi:hypothetical protein
LVEHLPRKEKVIGSIPIIGTQSIKEVRCKKAADFFLRQNLARNDFTLAFSDVLIFALVAG